MRQRVNTGDGAVGSGGGGGAAGLLEHDEDETAAAWGGIGGRHERRGPRPMAVGEMGPATRVGFFLYPAGIADQGCYACIAYWFQYAAAGSKMLLAYCSAGCSTLVRIVLTSSF